MNSKINIQKSYWRLKENVITTGQVINANVKMKLIKMFSILNKHVEINKWKSFYYILNTGKAEIERMDVSKIVRDRMDRSDLLAPGPFRATVDLA